MGLNTYGQLGDGNTDVCNCHTNYVPEQIVSSNVTAIAAGANHSLFLKSDGSLWAMGNNSAGQLGDGTYGSFPTFGSNQPEQIVSSNVTAIAAGGDHSLFLKNDGSLLAMGDNSNGELGDGTFNNTNVPEQIVSIPPAALGVTFYNGQPVVFIPTAAGTNYLLQMSTNLTSGIWVTVSNGTPVMAVQITNAPGKAFFRLKY